MCIQKLPPKVIIFYCIEVKRLKSEILYISGLLLNLFLKKFMFDFQVFLLDKYKNKFL